MSKTIFSVGLFVIIVVTIATFWENDIVYWYTHTFNENQFKSTTINEYFYEDNFAYVNNYTGNDVSNKKQMIDLIYYFINSGEEEINAYCVLEYKNCIDDLINISSDKESLSLLNNFVHPYNSFSDLIFSYDDYGNFTINVIKLYDQNMIDNINKIADEFINNNVKTNMKTEDKLKLVHDFIIDNSQYDKLKMENIYDETYKSKTAYGVLIEHYGICSGYADTLSIFLDKLNIANYKISNVEHIWNLAYINNKWVHIDLTWDDPISDNPINRTDYFMINTDKLQSLDSDHYFNKYIFEEAQ